jgi:hypothetical protein
MTASNVPETTFSYKLKLTANGTELPFFFRSRARYTIPEDNNPAPREGIDPALIYPIAPPMASNPEYA